MEILNDYIIYADSDHFLGKGAFSRVYQGKYIGEDKNNIINGTIVAAKIIKTSTLNKKTAKILEDEINITMLIRNNPHPNIVECYDVVRQDQKLYIIMEYCDSGDLRSILGKPIKERYTQFYFSQLANGLKYLDQINIVHRDIKPRNILLTHKRRVLKIADFGFAKQTTEQSLYETICGSPLYMAPEIMGNHYYNKQTDLWSIGMILYEMLYGFHPYQDCKSLPELIKNINNNTIDIPPSKTSNKDVSKSCLELLNILLQKDVKHRITWEEFFNHPWLSEYQYIAPYKKEDEIFKKNREYEKHICSVSVGSLATRDEHDYFEKMHSKIEIIEDYMNKHISVEGNVEPIDHSVDNKNIYYPDDGIFEMEMDTDVSEKEYEKKNIKIKSVVEKSSILDRLDEMSNQYEIVDDL